MTEEEIATAVSDLRITHAFRPTRHLTIRTTHREAGLVRMQPQCLICASPTPFVQLAIWGRARQPATKKGQPAGSAPLPETVITMCFARAQTPRQRLEPERL